MVSPIVVRKSGKLINSVRLRPDFPGPVRLGFLLMYSNLSDFLRKLSIPFFLPSGPNLALYVLTQSREIVLGCHSLWDFPVGVVVRKECCHDYVALHHAS